MSYTHENYVSCFLLSYFESSVENCLLEINWHGQHPGCPADILCYIINIWICFLPWTFRNPHPKHFSALCSWLIAPMLFQALCTVYIRYRWLRLVSNEERSLRCCNIMALVFGGLSALGLSLVANFQVTMKKHFYLLSTWSTAIQQVQCYM